jgi:hypothetical protein
VPEIRRVAFQRGWRWVAGGWQLFLRKPLTWVFFTVALWALIRVSGVHWVLASAMAVLLPVFLGGWVMACARAERGESIPVSMFYAGFRRRAGELSAVGAFNVVGNLLVLLVVAGIGGENFMQVMTDPAGVDPQDLARAYTRVLQALLVGVAVGIPVAMAVWFAPLAVALDGAKPVEALAASLRAMARNALPFLLYGLVWLGVGVALFWLAASLLPAAVALELALWLMMPVLVPSVYVSYRDIFAPRDGEAPPP